MPRKKARKADARLLHGSSAPSEQNCFAKAFLRVTPASFSMLGRKT
ncbi:hypothetical protein AmDm5_0961 [Acetobacter malorum]|nr:hypothetical protein AmDm5_0961 [Acetobacter malorum]